MPSRACSQARGSNECNHLNVEINSFGRQLLFTTVRIEATLADGTKSVGTGFIFNANRQGLMCPILVTNKHVIEGAATGKLWFIASEGFGPRLGDAVDINYANFDNQWTGHPDDNVDVTCMPLTNTVIQADAAGRQVFYKAIGSDIVPNTNNVADLDAIEEIVFAGYPDALYDTENKTPIVRRGITATPMELNYRGLPTFLIDASVFPGSSGSPVFVLQKGGFKDGNAFRVGSSRVFFVGILASGHIRAETGEISLGTSPTVKFNQLMDLGIVFNWLAVDEAVEACCIRHGINRDQKVVPDEGTT